MVTPCLLRSMAATTLPPRGTPQHRLPGGSLEASPSTSRSISVHVNCLTRNQPPILQRVGYPVKHKPSGCFNKLKAGTFFRRSRI